jgi:hypothetical protein
LFITHGRHDLDDDKTYGGWHDVHYVDDRHVRQYDEHGRHNVDDK